MSPWGKRKRFRSDLLQEMHSDFGHRVGSDLASQKEEEEQDKQERENKVVTQYPEHDRRMGELNRQQQKGLFEQLLTLMASRPQTPPTAPP